MQEFLGEIFNMCVCSSIHVFSEQTLALLSWRLGCLHLPFPCIPSPRHIAPMKNCWASEHLEAEHVIFSYLLGQCRSNFSGSTDYTFTFCFHSFLHFCFLCLTLFFKFNLLKILAYFSWSLWHTAKLCDQAIMLSPKSLSPNRHMVFVLVYVTLLKKIN